MKTETRLLKEKAQSYGLNSLNNQELFALIGYKGEAQSFYSSSTFFALKEAIRRREVSEIKKISNSSDAYPYVSFLEGLDHEQFWCLYLKNNQVVIKNEFISKGAIGSTVVDVRIIMKNCIILGATKIILCHNHPSGELRASNEDISITFKIKEAAKFMDITVLDHLIIGNGANEKRYYSFAEDGIL